MAEVYVGKDVTVEIWDSTETIPYTVSVAQEVIFNPNQEIEGIDGLGSDLIQVWAPGLKTFEGTLSQLMVSAPNQLYRLAPFQTCLEEHVMYLTWDDDCVPAQTIRVRLTGVIFPRGSIPSPKNAAVILEMPFRAKNATIAVT